MATESGLPDAEDVADYLDGSSWTEEQIGDALAAETLAQQRVCRMPVDMDDYPDDLREALLRRVAVNLDRRRQMSGTPGTDVEVPMFAPVTRDPEVRRLEAPHRKLVMG